MLQERALPAPHACDWDCAISIPSSLIVALYYHLTCANSPVAAPACDVVRKQDKHTGIFAQVYPWALLVFWQLLMPGVSFWGHLGGLMAGEAYVRGWLKALVPSESALQASAAGRPYKSPYRRVAAKTTICFQHAHGM